MQQYLFSSYFNQIILFRGLNLPIPNPSFLKMLRVNFPSSLSKMLVASELVRERYQGAALMGNSHSLPLLSNPS